MRISYKKLFDLMKQKGFKKTDLRKNGFSPTVVNRLVKDDFVNTLTILKLCEFLECQPGDIMECIDDEGFTHLVPTREGLNKLQEQETARKRQK
ncbi:MAG TPA: helix-turn-helix transcriptional regulator [Candidatus Faecalibacterium gallistercoris]|uniref:Helix-turn-helix transcriptional regulator n=1 Tax=Candidatus Faecalibacterium gallistercoris TaxID=2838579 RepID=A0A9D2FGT2_9FIRM|nr:helix-turn-helix transcriptional regulator [Candidatus Faecalibacterium gallistercoris]